MYQKAEDIFISTFNGVLAGIKQESLEIKEELEIDDYELHTFIYQQLDYFYTRINDYYIAELEIAKRQKDQNRVEDLTLLFKFSVELSDELFDLSIDQFKVFISLYNPESSFDIFGTIQSARMI